MLSPNMEQALNQQIQEEVYSFYIYLAMSAYLESSYLKGMATWMQIQAKEEMGHAMKLFNYLQERGATPTLQAIQQPPKAWASPLAVFETALAHEQHITACIHGLVELAATERDHASASFLQWFVNEQVEEEATVDPIVHRLRLVGDNIAALYVMDRDLGQRGA